MSKEKKMPMTEETEGTKNISSYSAKDIKSLKGLEPVRQSPGMYIGSVGEQGLHQILWEILDNATDEVLAGYANRVEVVLHPDGSATVTDNGRGIPVDTMKDSGKSAVEAIFTELHTGGKFTDKNYKFSAGMHGVGGSATNALSRWMVAQIKRDGHLYRIKFHSVKDKDGKVLAGIVEEPLTVIGSVPKGETGSSITFLPDDTVFETTVFNADAIERRIMELAALIPGRSFTFTDLRGKEPVRQEYVFENGLQDYVAHLSGNENNKNFHPNFFHVEENNYELDLCFIYDVDSSVLTGDVKDSNFATKVKGVHLNDEILLSYVNNLRTYQDGSHVIGFHMGFTRAFNDFVKETNYFKTKDVPQLTGDDFRKSFVGVLSVKMNGVQFSSQIKSKLDYTPAKDATNTATYNIFKNFLSNPDNKKAYDVILRSAYVSYLSRTTKYKLNQISTDKFAPCSGNNPEDNEIFIVEGDSAGGSAKQGRDRHTQAVLPLRGKPLNVMKASWEQIYGNEEISILITALGTNIRDDFDIKNLNYGKIIILSDADFDGYHIRTLLIALFYHLAPELIAQGHVYVGLPPLYKVSKKDKIMYAYDDNELDAVVKEMESYPGERHIQRYKGLGEMSKDQLWETTLNPKTRLLMRITIEDAAEAADLLNTLMAKETEKRKNYIFSHACFNRIDTFDEKYGGKK